MAIPKSREEFKQAILRRLGHPVIHIEVSHEQLDDRIDEALAYYQDYHFDAYDKCYYKFQVTADNRPDKVYDVIVLDGGKGYANTDVVTFTANDTNGKGATGTLTTDVHGTIQSITVTDRGEFYAITPDISIATSTGEGARFNVRMGGIIPVPENIIGAIKIFDLSTSMSSHDLFSIQYQVALNELYNFTSISMVPYYSAFQHIDLIQQVLIGQQHIRYVRHKNAVHLDTNWNRFVDGQFLIVEAYEIVDPEVYTDVWKDRWLTRYATALVKWQWGNNLKKYGNMQMMGGVAFNGQQIHDEAVEEIAKMEEEMKTRFELPPLDMIG